MRELRHWLTALAALLLLSGCLLQGFELPDDYAPSHPGAAEPVAHGATFVRPASEDTPAIYLRFQRVLPQRYLLEAFVDEVDEPMLIVQQVALVPLADGWHAMHWATPDSRLPTQGYSLVRFADQTLQTADPGSQLERVNQLAALAGLAPKQVASGDIQIKPASEAKLLDFLQAVVATAGLRVETLPVATLPPSLQASGYHSLVERVSGLTLARDGALMPLAKAYFEVLQQAGQGLGAYGLARLYANGWTVPQDGGRAREFASQAVGKAVPQANHILGWSQYYGIGVTRDPVAAVQHFRLAADAGVGAASYELGMASLKGEGLPRDLAQARVWFEQAVAAGAHEANAELAQLLLGERTPASTTRALALIKQGMAHEQANAFYLSSKVHFNGLDGKADWQQSFHHTLRAAELGLPKAQYQAGAMLLEGMGTERHDPHGHYWLRLAAEAGNVEAKNRLAELKVPGWRPLPSAVFRSSRTYLDEDKDFRIPATTTVIAAGYHGPTPLRVPGARTLTTHELQVLLKSGTPPLLIDVYHETESVTGALSWPQFGLYRPLSGRIAQTQAALDLLSGGDRQRAVVFLCVSVQCWHSYNAALYALEAGYTDVLWYRGGLASWKAAGLPTAQPAKADWRQQAATAASPVKAPSPAVSQPACAEAWCQQALALTEHHLTELKAKARQLRAELRKCPPSSNPALVCSEIEPPPTLLKSPEGGWYPVYFFSYHCKKCAAMSQFVEHWSQSRRVFVYRLHAVWNDRLQRMATAYYALQQLKSATALSPQIYQAVADNQLSFNADTAEFIGFASAQGVDATLLKAALADEETLRQVALAKREVGSYKISGVPVLYINGRYQLQVNMALFDEKARQDLAALLDEIMAQEQLATEDGA